MSLYISKAFMIIGLKVSISSVSKYVIKFCIPLGPSS